MNFTFVSDNGDFYEIIDHDYDLIQKKWDYSVIKNGKWFDMSNNEDDVEDEIKLIKAVWEFPKQINE